MGAVAQIFFKMASEKVEWVKLQTILNRELIIAFLLYGLASLLFVHALKFGRVTVIYPVISTSYIWVMILGSKVLGEKVDLKSWLGAIMIILGVYLIVAKS